MTSNDYELYTKKHGILETKFNLKVLGKLTTQILLKKLLWQTIQSL